MSLSVILSIVAGITHLAAFGLYNKQVLKGTSRPNTTTWTLWTFESALNCASYLVMTRDWQKALTPMGGAFACGATLLFSFYKGKLSKLDFWDSIILIIGLVSCFVWWWSRSATYANLILQLCVSISFIPTYRGVWENPAVEKALPWFVWGVSYILIIAVIFLRWEDQYQDLVYPVMGLVLHSGVGVVSLWKRIPFGEDC